ncbi:tripartite tricarboxylate transporter substrate binding protein [Pigmentiphaga daeguensis]|uniref:Tripartite tricarboxylate transporter substrate binding protein n=1 Tax=Pigmentiphaga daeguensis TaxID=414049 RepID=A0ABN1BV13_9BURK
MNTHIARRRLLAAATAGIMAGALPMPGLAQDYPSKPVTLVIPYQGGITEQLGRLYATELEKVLGKSVIVEVKPGAGGVIGGKYAARAPADGYTLVVTSGLTQETAQGRFDTFAELEAITAITSQAFLLYVKPDSPITTIKDYVEYAKRHPGKLTYGSVGPNTSAHIIGQTLEKSAGIKLVHVPYKGGGAQALAVMSGELASGYLTSAFIKPYVEGKTLRPIAIVSDQRSEIYPDVPTIVEAGYPDLAPVGSSWFGIFAPKGLPAPVKDALVKAAGTIHDAGPVAAFVRNSGGVLLTAGPAYATKKTQEDIDFWKAFYRTHGAK